MLKSNEIGVSVNSTAVVQRHVVVVFPDDEDVEGVVLELVACVIFGELALLFVRLLLARCLRRGGRGMHST
jgi:hypothetical protein